MALGQFYARVKITDTGGTERTIGNEVLDFAVSFRDRAPHDFVMRVSDPNQIWRDRYEVGSDIKIYMEQASPPTFPTSSIVWLGQIVSQDVERTQPQTDFIVYGTDLFWSDAEFLHVTEKLGTDATTIEKTGTKVRRLFQTYLSDYDRTNIALTDVDMRTLTLLRVPFIQALDDMANHSGSEWYIDYTSGNKNANMFQRGNKGDQATIDATLASNILAPLTKTLDIDNVRNSITVEGANTLADDITSSATLDANKSLHAKYHAVSFTPTKIRVDEIQLGLDKIGTPPDDLVIYIVDDNGSDTPRSLDPWVNSTTFISEDTISGAAKFYAIPMNVELIPNRKYWLLAQPVGDASNTYRWYYDNASAANSKDSSDGATWAAISKTLSFKTEYSKPVYAVATNDDSISKYGRRELLLTRKNIAQEEQAKRLALGLVSKLAEPQEQLSDLVCGVQTTWTKPIFSTQPVKINIPSLSISNKSYYVIEARYVFKSGFADQISGTWYSKCDRVTLRVGDHMQNLNNHIRDIERKLRLEESVDQEIDFITRVRAYSKKLKLTKTYTRTQSGADQVFVGPGYKTFVGACVVQ